MQHKDHTCPLPRQFVRFLLQKPFLGEARRLEEFVVKDLRSTTLRARKMERTMKVWMPEVTVVGHKRKCQMQHSQIIVHLESFRSGRSFRSTVYPSRLYMVDIS